ncbi:MAG: amidohydrolase family protein [Candidatus Eisenbacteria bacterium]
MSDSRKPVAPPVTDIHVHVQPAGLIRAGVADAFRREGWGHYEYYAEVCRDPAVLLEEMNRQGIARVGLVNDVSPDVTGFDESSNDFCLAYADRDRTRLLPITGVNALRVKDGAAEVDRLADSGSVALKIHPPHQGYAANAYTEGLESLGSIYRRAEERNLPVVIHTGTSVFPGARCKYSRPMDLDDVAVDFPRLRIVMAHGGRPIWYDEAFFLLRRHPNLWLDISGIPVRRIPDFLPRLPEIGTRVMYGSDWPGLDVLDFRTNADKFLELPFPDEWKAGVLDGHSRILFP